MLYFTLGLSLLRSELSARRLFGSANCASLQMVQAAAGAAGPGGGPRAGRQLRCVLRRRPQRLAAAVHAPVRRASQLLTR